MNIGISLLVFVVGLGLVLCFAGKLVKGAVGTSIHFGVSAFVVSVIFIGFDPENLAVGAVASVNQVPGIVLGSIIGSTMVAIGLAFGLTAMLCPMTFKQVPVRILILPNLAMLLFAALTYDGSLSRLDGLILFLGFIGFVLYLLTLSKQGYNIESSHDFSEKTQKNQRQTPLKSLGLLLLSLFAIILGSEMMVLASKFMMSHWGISDTFFGMIILAFLVSIEEVARELPAALKGRADISFGNVVGSVFAFFLFNAGIIAMLHPVQVDIQTRLFYLPVCFVTMVLISIFMLKKRITRSMGGMIMVMYLIFVIGGYILN
ncbi:sodium:calcium antiporter [Legionella yabuuchiae]|uniref:sodium:calcium antiporter n=1 Tax=Legionella yabuuchiae TaxID=376727 RepID=UPI0010547282|nr:sodium:calcium antiporter [Legionella yabuuchiae]